MKNQRHDDGWWEGWFALLLGFAIVMAMMFSARAHDMAGESDWIQEGHYYDKITRQSCCGLNDCRRLDDEEVHETPEGLRIDTPPAEVFPYARILWVSKDGHYWRCAAQVCDDWRTDNKCEKSHQSPEARCVLGPPRSY